MLLNLIPFHPIATDEQQPMVCPECGGLIRIIAV
jgi:hypothetical protein